MLQNLGLGFKGLHLTSRVLGYTHYSGVVVWEPSRGNNLRAYNPKGLSMERKAVFISTSKKFRASFLPVPTVI